MRINPFAGGVFSALGLGSQAVSAAATAAQDAASAVADAPTGASSAPGPATASAAVRDIMAHYDLRNISPREFSELLNELTTAGHLDDQGERDLAQVRLQLDVAGLDPDEPTDLLGLVRDRLVAQEDRLLRLDARDRETADAAPEIEAARRQFARLVQLAVAADPNAEHQFSAAA